MKRFAHGFITLAAFGVSLPGPCIGAQAQESGKFCMAFPAGALCAASPSDAKVAASFWMKRIVHGKGCEYSTEASETREESIHGLRVGSYDFFLIETIDDLNHCDEIATLARIGGASDGQQILNKLRMQRLALLDDRCIESVERLVARQNLPGDPQPGKITLVEAFDHGKNPSARAGGEPSPSL